MKGGRVLDPSQGVDRTADVGFSAGKVAKIGADLPADATTVVRDVAGYCRPGLIDLHHVYWGGTSCRCRTICAHERVTTCIDTGSAGPGNFAGFRKHVIEPSAVRILAYLHVSFAGIYAYSKTVMVGESEELRLMAPAEAVQVAEENRDLIIGIKVRVGRNSSGTSGTAPLDIALQAANEAGLPLMSHRLSAAELRRRAGAPSTRRRVDARVSAVSQRAARSAGQGEGSRAAGARARCPVRHRSRQGFVRVQDSAWNARDGFDPDTISSDVHALCINGPAFDQVRRYRSFFAWECRSTRLLPRRP